jgi:16S rRNA processing protein RimM
LNDLVTVGRVGRPHGVDGSFFVEGASDAPERFARGAVLLVDGEPAEITVSKRGAGGRPVIKLERPVARGATLAVRRDELPEPEEDAYYVFQLVGLSVEEEGGRALGTVNDSGLLLPLVESCVLDIDLDAGRILVARGFADADE